ncbi:MAG: hypothetical protein ACKORK_02420, partial [Gemmatimonadota bacterium]
VHADAGDLGATLHEALTLLLARCPDGALLMGADVPLIGSATIAAAARILSDGGTRDVALVPRPDDAPATRAALGELDRVRSRGCTGFTPPADHG